MREHYKATVEKSIADLIDEFPTPDRLRKATAYALTNGGKRLRPILCLMVADALGRDSDALDAALAIECLHCASLVADDLPCMDDDDMRRDRPSVHKAYDEATALLVSYALIAEGYRLIAKAGMKHEGHVGLLALENATYNSGLYGATGGQYLDMYPEPASEESLREVIKRKTISLFEISFVFGWLFGGGEVKQLPLVQKLAAHYGMAFQVADDLGDVEQDALQDKQVNYAVALGVDQALACVASELASYRSVLRELGIATDALLALADLLEGMICAHNAS